MEDKNKNFDLDVYKTSFLKALEIEKFAKENGKELSVSDLKDITACFFINSMKFITENRRSKNQGNW